MSQSNISQFFRKYPYHFSFSHIQDEKEKYDPVGFRDSILAGFAEAGDDLDSIYKYLDSAGSKLDYRRYGEALFDILIAGGLLGKIRIIQNNYGITVQHS